MKTIKNENENDLGIQLLTDPKVNDDLSVWERATLVMIGLGIQFMPLTIVHSDGTRFIMSDDGIYDVMQWLFPKFRGELLSYGPDVKAKVIGNLECTNLDPNWIELIATIWKMLDALYQVTGKKLEAHIEVNTLEDVDDRKRNSIH